MHDFSEELPGEDIFPVFHSNVTVSFWSFHCLSQLNSMADPLLENISTYFKSVMRALHLIVMFFFSVSRFSPSVNGSSSTCQFFWGKAGISFTHRAAGVVVWRMGTAALPGYTLPIWSGRMAIPDHVSSHRSAYHQHIFSSPLDHAGSSYRGRCTSSTVLWRAAMMKKLMFSFSLITDFFYRPKATYKAYLVCRMTTNFQSKKILCCTQNYM